MEIDHLKGLYERESPRAERLRKSILEQLEQLFLQRDIALGVTMESRVKTWSSLAEKIERKSLTLKSMADLDDFIGIRTILLFRQDLPKVGTVIGETFEVLHVEDAGARLSEVQFGYQSQHYVVGLRPEWLRVPTFSGLNGLKVEIQVRTLAQHIWAAASHKLQYKHEESVPPPLRRTIHRVSALLETVDLEFERVLNERKIYIDEATDVAKPSETLNVDLLKAILQEFFPEKNMAESEDYADVLDALFALEQTTASQLRQLIKRNLTKVLTHEAETVRGRLEVGSTLGTTSDRLAAGVYFTHVGLARVALDFEFGANRQPRNKELGQKHTGERSKRRNQQ